MAKSFCTGWHTHTSAESCCEQHDKHYQTGDISRWDADLRLYRCIRDSGRPVHAVIAFIAVRLFGWLFYRG